MRYPLLLAFILSAAAAHAEGVVTKTDVVVEGRILKENDCGVLVEHISMGLISIPHSKIRFVIRAGQTEDEARATEPVLIKSVPGGTLLPPPAQGRTPPANGGAEPALPTGKSNGAGLDPLKANEASAVAACKAYIDAQDRYHRKDWDEDKVLEYAQSLKGNFSLYETKAGAGDIQLIDKTFADAEGDPLPGATARSGYRFKVLKAQGANAFGGAKSYLSAVNGKEEMTLGFALVAYPVEYGKTGVHTFLVSNAGVIWRKDLGVATPELVKEMKEFNPDKTWTIVE
ncbi:MAG TPA: DUF2950 family protein [Planctomycetota bacterium]|nr:DUF2950 family protein [Planctomycetota bacterium]